MNADASENKTRILIAEDNRVERLLLQKIIENGFKYSVTAAEDGLQAWEMFQDGLKPDACIIDIMMPRMDGIELIEKVHSQPASKKIPIIVCTAINDRFKISQIQSLDIGGYIVKPYTSKAVFNELENALARQPGKPNEMALHGPRTISLSSDIGMYIDQLKVFVEESKARLGIIKSCMELGAHDRMDIAQRLDQLAHTAKKLWVSGFIKNAAKIEQISHSNEVSLLAAEIDLLEKERQRIGEKLAAYIEDESHDDYY